MHKYLLSQIGLDSLHICCVEISKDLIFRKRHKANIYTFNYSVALRLGCACSPAKLGRQMENLKSVLVSRDCACMCQREKTKIDLCLSFIGTEDKMPTQC